MFRERDACGGASSINKFKYRKENITHLINSILLPGSLFAVHILAQDCSHSVSSFFWLSRKEANSLGESEMVLLTVLLLLFLFFFFFSLGFFL